MDVPKQVEKEDKPEGSGVRVRLKKL